MSLSRKLAFRARWAVPAGAVAAVGLVIAGSVIAGAQAAPALPVRTAAQLLADIARSAPPSSLSGVITSTASLGLPQLPDTLGGGISGLSLLTGTHTAKFWYAGPEHVRFAVQAQLGETDLRRDGRQVWLWDSKPQTATHIVLPARSGHRPDGGRPENPGPALTPQQAASQVLAAIGPTTKVSVQQNVTVAGRAAYQLALAPRDSHSLIGQVLIAVDAHGYLPLRLQVFASGAASPAYQVGFTALSFARPSASNFTFTPPPGAKVKNVQIPGRPDSGFRHALMGAAPTSRAYFSSRSKFVSSGPMRTCHRQISFLPAPRADGAERALQLSSTAPTGGAPTGKALRSGVVSRINSGPDGGPTVIGQGWLSVLVLSPGGPGQAAAGAGMLTGSLYSQLPGHASASAASSAYSSTLTISGPAGQAPAVLRALLRAATPVHGSWGSGRLLRTSLVSVLLTSSGHVLIGAVTPSVLYGDAAKVK